MTAAGPQQGACCAGQDIYDAKRVRRALGIPHYVLDYESRFRKAVIEDFADSYARGETPIPCVRCNQKVKFADLLDTARELGAEALATGHYVRRVEGANGAELHAAADASARPELFPVRHHPGAAGLSALSAGRHGKERGARARRRAGPGQCRQARQPGHLLCARQKRPLHHDCEPLRPDAARPGEIVDQAGAVLGRHDGIINFTVGQRKGLGLSGNDAPLFVLKLDAAKAQVVVGPRSALAASVDHAARCELAGAGRGAV